MASDARKHQKKAEKRNKRAKEKRGELVKSRNATPLTMLKRASSSTFLPCHVNVSAFSEGMGNVIVPRQLPNGMVVLVMFLVDLYCLGVKDIAINFWTREEYDSMVRATEKQSLQKILTKEEAKKLVEGSVAYARQFGILPYEDYEKSKAIFDGIDDSTCTTEFTFGKDGKPFYVNGPNDSASFQKRILFLLERNAGPGNFEFHFLSEGSDFDDGK